MEGLELDYRKRPRKLPMRKREDKAKRMCTFTKRRCGLFKKATDLHLLTGADIAVVVFSEAGRPYFHGSTAAIDRFLASTGGVDEEWVDRTLTDPGHSQPSTGGVEEEWVDQTLTVGRSNPNPDALLWQIDEDRFVEEDRFVRSLLCADSIE